MKAGGGGGAGTAPFGHGVGQAGAATTAGGVAQHAGRYDEVVWWQPARAATVNATNNVRMRQIMLPSPNECMRQATPAACNLRLCN